MSEIDSKQMSDEGGPPATGEEPNQPEADPWDRFIVPMLWFMGTYVVVGQIAKKWLPEYLALGIAFFVGVLMVFSFGGRRFRRYGLRKSTALALLSSAIVSLLALAWAALSSALFRR